MDESQRVAHILEVAEELLSELRDTVFEDCPPEFYDLIAGDAGDAGDASGRPDASEPLEELAALAELEEIDDLDEPVDFDTVIDPIPLPLPPANLANLLDTLADSTPSVSSWVPSAQLAWAPPPPEPPRRSLFRSIIDAVKGWFGRPPAPAGHTLAPGFDPLDERSNAWTYTMADRQVAQARNRRAGSTIR
jgi:hypothetical protein